MTQVTLRAYLQSIEDALTSEQVDDALSKCQHVQTQFPDALEVQRLLGETYLKQGKMQEAQQAFDWVLTNDPENVVVYCDRALISERMNDYDTALDCYQQAYELSRGNSAIRHQFNMLSTRTGQQGFMLSRAGLARLYMRGDLLSQASQEWEIVLHLMPERLDARTGLLETYWREGLDERVEQLAHQILRDIPECLKALLLLAHVTAPRDMQQARELIQRAEMLDPDLIMARELFGDAIAAQPGHPFWKLVNKSPVVVAQVAVQAQATHVEREQFNQVPVREQVLVPDMLARESSSAAYNDWRDLEGWQNLHSVPQLPTFTPQQASPAQALSSSNDEWMQTQDEQDAPSLEQENIWASSRHAENELQGTMSSPPAWLSMLTQDEQRTPRKQPEPPAHLTEQQAVDDAKTSAEVRHDNNEVVWGHELQNSLNEVGPIDDEEDSFFGPAWLKSLGAASIDEEPQLIENVRVEEQVISSAGTASATPAPLQTTEQEVASVTDMEASPALADTYEWIQSLEPSAMTGNGEEQNIVTTLEGLEQDLRSQGFVPLEPKTLSTIAQSQQEPAFPGALSVGGAAEQEVREPVHEYHSQEPDSLLSSVLAQLGNYSTTSQPSQEEHSLSVPFALEPGAPQSISETPLWAAELAGVSSPTPVNDATMAFSASGEERNVESATPSSSQQNADASPQQHLELPGQLSFHMPVEQGAWVTSVEPPLEQAAENRGYVELQSPVVSSVPPIAPTPMALPVPVPQSERLKPAASFNEVFSDDLEVTMKRPAVRLQPVQQAHSAQNVSSRASTHAPQSDRLDRREARTVNASDGGLSNQERLRRGYQHQLVGDYDEAMQEYRIIIRNAPELLGEIVSNVRALLKISPRYSAGYRVLGDAYMRQGEYLQAMDAYNKALAITKKARV